jgi:hypothetical protein
MVVTCLLLGISGGVRFWRDLKFSTLAKENTTSPFSLKELPRTLEDWYAPPELDSKLDPEIARLAGSSDHIIRIYKNKKTDEQVTALVLYGLANSVFGHTPEVCYPAAGYQQSVASANHEFSVPDSLTKVIYRSAAFIRGTGAIGQYEEAGVCYTFLHNGEWLPELASRWKSFRYHPAIFKIQLQHRSTRFAIEGSPTEGLLKHFVDEINSRVSHTNKTQLATAASLKP